MYDETINKQDTSVSETPDIAKLWELETIEINEKFELLTNKERDVLSDFVDAIVYDNNYYYVVELPWKNDPSILPINYNIAKGQLSSLMIKLRNDDPVRYYEHYKNIFENYKSQGFIEKLINMDI